MNTKNSRVLFLIDLSLMYVSFYGFWLYYKKTALISPKAVLLLLIIAFFWFLITINSDVTRIDRQSRVFKILTDTFVGYSVLSAAVIALVAIFGQFRPNDKLVLFPIFVSVITSACLRVFYLLSIRHVAKNGYQQKAVLIVGGGVAAAKVADRIIAFPELGYRLHGVLSNRCEERFPEGFFLGGLERFTEVVRSAQIDEVIIAKPLCEEQTIYNIVEKCENEGVRFRIVLDFFRIIRNQPVFSTLGDIPLVAIRTEPLALISNRLIKRGFDIIVAALLLAMLAPFFLVLAVLIKYSSAGPVFFKQRRMGANNREFDIYKFRSMVVGQKQDADTIWTTENDQRVTPIGCFMRKSSIDELPQLWNVLKGDMSLVGPRPERGHFVEQFRKEIPGYKVRHLIKSGITGWAQVNGWRGDTSISKRVEHDIWYIENWSFWLDLKILWLTIFSRKAHQNAY